jgi:hypothetical protein
MRNRFHKLRYGRPLIQVPHELEQVNESDAKIEQLRWDDPQFMMRVSDARHVPLRTHFCRREYLDSVSVRLPQRDRTERTDKEVFENLAAALGQRAHSVYNLFFYRTLREAAREFQEQDDRSGTSWKLFARPEAMLDMRQLLSNKPFIKNSRDPSALLGIMEHFQETLPSVFCLQTKDIEAGFKVSELPLGLYWLDPGAPDQIEDPRNRETIYTTRLRAVFWLDRRFVRMITEV